jgi:TRAP-type C4-dicarboxylate transport system permease small subunit
MRAALDGLYRLSGGLAAFCVAAIAGLVAVQVTGRLLGVLVPGADDLAGYALMAASFLALGPTLRAGVHIRVTLLLRQAPAATRRRLELWCLGLGTVLSGYLGWHVLDMAWDAWRYGERSTGNLGVPLWLPQGVMAFGILVLTVALLDDLVRVVRGGQPSYPDDLGALEAPPPRVVADGKH